MPRTALAQADGIRACFDSGVMLLGDPNHGKGVTIDGGWKDPSPLPARKAIPGRRLVGMGQLLTREIAVGSACPGEPVVEGLH